MPANSSPAYGAGTTVAVVGLGKIGLPLAAQYASRGLKVLGCDVDPRVVDLVSRGQNPVLEEPDLAERVAAGVAAGRLSATTDTADAVGRANAVVVIVPLVVGEDGAIDYSRLDSATDDVGRGLRAGTLVIFETTLPVGTTRKRLAPALARRSGLEQGSDFLVAFSPERVFSGRIFRDLRRYPKIVGGLDERSTAAAAAFYTAALDFDPALKDSGVLCLGSAEAAEFTKLVETTYRDVNIGLANEFARFADRWGIDANEVIDAANSQPFSHVHRPGVGVGGHCIPVYPHFLLQDARAGAEMQIPRAARQRNDQMASYGVDLLRDELGGLAGRRVLVLGYAYRDDVREDFLSSAKLLIKAIERAGGTALVHDPLYGEADLRARGLTPYDLGHPTPVDAAILQANHSAYADLDFGSLPGCKIVLDGRGAIDPSRVEGHGIRYLAVGRAGLRATSAASTGVGAAS